ncbi:MAG TPA: sugar phosphate isomerase/epimerase family protein [Caldilineaceae bacterium]|nr:sugar phosphate isomerase/epimerase family protein [Caldilineaceae bacterium]
MIRLGCCCPVDQAEIARSAGFDYLECTVVSLLPEEGESAFAPVRARYREAPLPVEAFNVFLPRDLKVVGPAVDWLRVERYVAVALARVAEIGARVVVFGSGGARQTPDGFGREAAEEQLIRFLSLVADHAEAHEITIAIEPLNRQESNMLNSVPEAAALAERVDRPSVRVLADFYHMQVEGEPLDHIRAHGDRLAHIHVADSGRLAPGRGDYPYAAFAAELAAIGYGARGWSGVSVECRWQDFEREAPEAVAFLRGIWPAGDGQ